MRYINAFLFSVLVAGPVFAAVPPSLKPKEVLELVTKNSAVIVDVRETDERSQVIENARSAPMSKLNDEKFAAEFVRSLPKNKTVIFHCAAGVRSKKMAEKFSKLGLHTAYFRGPSEWQEAGLPLKTGP